MRVTNPSLAPKPGMTAHFERADMETTAMSNQFLCRLSALCDGLLPQAGAAFALVAVGAVVLTV